MVKKVQLHLQSLTQSLIKGFCDLLAPLDMILSPIIRKSNLFGLKLKIQIMFLLN